MIREFSVLKEVSSALAKVSCKRRDLESLIGLLNFSALYLLFTPSPNAMEQCPYPHSLQRPPSDSNSPVQETSPLDKSIILAQSVPIRLHTPSIILMTDARTTGWGGICLPQGVSGKWPMSLKSMSMNFLELKFIENFRSQ